MKLRHHLVITFILVISLFSNLKSINNSHQALQQLKNSKSELDQLKVENVNLTDQIESTQTQKYIEQQAFEKFNLVKEGGTVLIVDQKMPTQQSDQSVLGEQTSKQESLWQKLVSWIKSLF